MKELTITLPDNLFEALDAETKQTGKSPSQIIQALVESKGSLDFFDDFFKQLEKTAEIEFKETMKLRDSRILSEEGVPVFLLLDDLRENKPEAGINLIEPKQTSQNLFLSLLSAYYMKFRNEGKSEINSGDIGEVVGALADRYFATLAFEEWRKG